MDTLSEILRGVKLTGAVFMRAELSAPWCVAVPTADAVRRLVMPAAEHLTRYHLITEGRCAVQPVGGERTLLEAGDIVLFPHHEAHFIGSDLHIAPANMEAIAARPGWERLPLIRYGGGGEVAKIVCGFLACDPRLCRPVLSALPTVVKVHLRSSPTGAWIENSIRYALEQAMTPRPGGEALLAKLSETLFVETLRAYVETLPEERTGWFASLRDPLVGMALALMHQQPAYDWTLEELAKRVGTSRTVLADRFTHFLGEPPISYLTRWRLALAAELLRSSRAALVRVAETVGYNSEAAFNRAFKREYGVPPATWRRSWKRSAPLEEKTVSTSEQPTNTDIRGDREAP